MAYYINFKSIPLSKFEGKLTNAYLPPSRMVLKKNIQVIFGYFKEIGIENLHDLHQKLKNKQWRFEMETIGIFPSGYLNVLLREINSLHPKAQKLSEFTNIPKETADLLAKNNITDTFKLYEAALTPQSRLELAYKTGIKLDMIEMLSCLADLSRIKWVGPTFAMVLYKTGFQNVQKVANAIPAKMHTIIQEQNQNKELFNGNIGLNDIKVCILAAKELSNDIEF